MHVQWMKCWAWNEWRDFNRVENNKIIACVWIKSIKIKLLFSMFAKRCFGQHKLIDDNGVHNRAGHKTTMKMMMMTKLLHFLWFLLIFIFELFRDKNQKHGTMLMMVDLGLSIHLNLNNGQTYTHFIHFFIKLQKKRENHDEL